MKTSGKFILTLFLIIIFNVLQAEWSDDPALNTPVGLMTGSQVLPKVAACTSGDVYVCWFSNQSGNYNVRLQRFSYQGDPQWQENGILISDYPSMSWLTDWDMTADHEGNCIISFQDIRLGGNNNIVAYKISPEGTFVWGDAGLQLSDSNAFDVSPKIEVTSENNTVIAWQADDVVIMQKISPGGDLLWGDNGITLSCENTYSWPQLLAVEADNVILKIFEDSGTPWAPDRYVYAQKFDNEGNPLWPDYTIVTEAGGIAAWTQLLSMAYDGTGGFYIAWHDDRNMDMISQSYVQHISSDGEVLFIADGVEVAQGNSRQRFYPHLAYMPDAGDVYCYWNEMDLDQNNRGVYGQRFDEAGNRLWDDSGKIIIELTDRDIFPFAARACQNGVMVFYEDTEAFPNNYAKAMLLDQNGEFIWPGEYAMLSNVSSEKLHYDVDRYNNGQWIVSWEDRRDDDGDVYAQNVRLNGEIGGIDPPPVNLAIDAETAVLSWEEPLMMPDIYNIYLDGEYLTSTIEQQYQYTGLNVGQTYTAGVSAVYPDGESDIMSLDFLYSGTGINDDLIEPIITGVKNSPNPFHFLSGPGRSKQSSRESGTRISFRLSQTADIRLAVYNLKGQLVKVLLDSIKQAGEHSVVWYGTDLNENPVPAGIYLYRISDGTSSSFNKMMLLK